MKNNKLLMISLLGLSFGVISRVEAMQKTIPFRLQNWEKFPIEIKFENSTPIRIDLKEAYNNDNYPAENTIRFSIRENRGIEEIPAKKVFGIKVSSEKLQEAWGEWKEYWINLYPQTSVSKLPIRDAVFLKYANAQLSADTDYSRRSYTNRVQNGQINRVQPK